MADNGGVTVPQPWEDIDGSDRTDSDLLSLEEEAMPRRLLMVQMADALVSATLVGHPAPIVREMYERMSAPRPGDLVVEQSARRDPDRCYRGFGILLACREEWATKDEEWERYLQAEREASPDGTVFDDERIKERAWYIQYGPSHRDICRWENATFVAVPVELARDATRALCDHERPRAHLRRSPAHRPPLGGAGQLAAHPWQAGHVLGRRRAAVV